MSTNTISRGIALTRSSTLIYFFRGQGQVANNLLQASPREIAIPSVVLFELEYGLARSNSPEKRRQQFYELLAIVPVWPLGEKEARTAGLIRAELEENGMPIGPFDLLIAATAVANHGTLVTHNLKEFGRIKGLNFVDWF